MRRCMSKYLIFTIVALSYLSVRAEEAQVDSTQVAKTDSVSVDSLPTVKDLDELVVERSNVIRRGNTDSYIVTEEMRKGKYTAGELLRNISGMDYEPMSEEVRYLGSTNVIILVDSIEKDASYIKRQSPNRFDRIDIVERPGGQYRGYDVLINYHPRPHYVGLEINMRSPFAIRPEDNGKGKAFANISPYVDATYMYEKLTITGIVNWQWARSASSTYSSTEYPMNQYSETIELQDRRDPIRRQRHSYLKGQLSGDYKINDRHKVSALWTINSNNVPVSSNYTLNVNDKGLLSKVGVSLKDDIKGVLNNTVGLYYQGLLGEWNLSASSSYMNSGYKTHYSLNRTDGYSLLYDRKGAINYGHAKINLGRSFNNYKWGLNILAESFVNKTSETDIYSGIVLSKNTTLYNNLYGCLSFNPSQKWSFYADAGFTLYTNSDGTGKRTQIEPRWQVNVNWFPSKDVRINAFYLMQTGSPMATQLQAFGQFTDMYKYQEGNPMLKASLYNMAYIGFTFWRKFVVFGRFDATNNGVYNIYGFRNTDPMDPASGYYYAYGQYQNGRSRTYTIGTNLSQKLGRGFSIRLDGSMARQKASYNGYSNHIWKPAGRFSISHQLEKINLYTGLMYDFLGGASVTPQQHQRSNIDLVRLYVSKQLFKNRMVVYAEWVVPVHLTNGEMNSWLVSPNMIQHSWSNEQFRDNNRVFINIAYRFTTGKQVRKVDFEVQSMP